MVIVGYYLAGYYLPINHDDERFTYASRDELRTALKEKKLELETDLEITKKCLKLID